MSVLAASAEQDQDALFLFWGGDQDANLRTWAPGGAATPLTSCPHVTGPSREPSRAASAGAVRCVMASRGALPASSVSAALSPLSIFFFPSHRVWIFFVFMLFPYLSWPSHLSGRVGPGLRRAVRRVARSSFSVCVILLGAVLARSGQHVCVHAPGSRAGKTAGTSGCGNGGAEDEQGGSAGQGGQVALAAPTCGPVEALGGCKQKRGGNVGTTEGYRFAFLTTRRRFHVEAAILKGGLSA